MGWVVGWQDGKVAWVSRAVAGVTTLSDAIAGAGRLSFHLLYAIEGLQHRRLPPNLPLTLVHSQALCH